MLRSVKCFFAPHDNVQRLATQQHTVFERVQLRHGGDEGRVLALDAHLLLDAYLLAAEVEDLIGFVVSWGACPAKYTRQSVAQAEAGERFITGCAVRLERADLQQQRRVQDAQVEGQVLRQGRIKRVLVERILPPGCLWAVEASAARQSMAGFLYVVVEQTQLASHKVGIGGIAGPRGHVNDIQTGVDGGPDGRQLGHDERGRVRCRRYGQLDGGCSARRGEAGQAQLHMLQRCVRHASARFLWERAMGAVEDTEADLRL